MTNSAPPRVSVVMANLNGAAHIAAAVGSVLRQSETSLELIVSDDGSTDDSLSRALGAAAGDPRLVVVRGGGRSGPGATRNRALAGARGGWIAIVDNDDLIGPDRLRRVIDAAEADRADIAVDNILVFHEDGTPPRPHLAEESAPRWIGAADYVRGNGMFAGRAQLGYLKPVFRRSSAPRYDETLFISEDFDLVLRLLIGGARMRLYPELGYFYRKHSASISHRLTPAQASAMTVALDRLPPNLDPDLQAALRKHRAALRDAGVYEAIVAALKRRDVLAACRLAAGRPSALPLLRLPILARFAPTPPAVVNPSWAAMLAEAGG
ncbi:MAG: glycosyltransferase family 2 protein [Hyphomonadaceae bacterium]